MVTVSLTESLSQTSDGPGTAAVLVDSSPGGRAGPGRWTLTWTRRTLAAAAAVIVTVADSIAPVKFAP